MHVLAASRVDFSVAFQTRGGHTQPQGVMLRAESHKGLNGNYCSLCCGVQRMFIGVWILLSDLGE